MNTAAAVALSVMTREEAIEIVYSSAFMVASSDQLIPNNTIIWQEYEVVERNGRSYKFEEMPFRIVRRITRVEYYKALPMPLRRSFFGGGFYYEIATD